MDIRIEPHLLSGAVTPPPSKSMAHRLMIAAALTCMALLRFSASSVAASMAGMIALLAEFISVFVCQTITAHKLEAQFHDMRDAMKDDD